MPAPSGWCISPAFRRTPTVSSRNSDSPPSGSLCTAVLEVDEPYVLILPTYGGGKANGPDPDAGGYVPKQVIAFLNNEHNRSLIRGVIAAGNSNFGAEFCYAGDVVSRKCGVPYLYRFELMGTPEDVVAVRAGLG